MPVDNQGILPSHSFQDRGEPGRRKFLLVGEAIAHSTETENPSFLPGFPARKRDHGRPGQEQDSSPISKPVYPQVWCRASRSAYLSSSALQTVWPVADEHLCHIVRQHLAGIANVRPSLPRESAGALDGPCEAGALASPVFQACQDPTVLNTVQSPLPYRPLTLFVSSQHPDLDVGQRQEGNGLRNPLLGLSSMAGTQQLKITTKRS